MAKNFFGKKDELILEIKVQPNSTRSEIYGIENDIILIRLKSLPLNGAANRECIKLLSKTFKCPKSSLEIQTGLRSKRKKMKFTLIDEKEIERLKQVYLNNV
ncbi:MAG: DUF167 domain-containing protein [Nitrospinota bacterium]|nr:DUF167 domain-containing protein [Nitrospinota bacterium]